MSSYVFPRPFADHLRDQFRRALPVLFTGAGFSQCAPSILRGRNIPSVNELKEALWEICFPGIPYENTSSLPGLFDNALLRHEKQLSTDIPPSLSADADSLPNWYSAFFALPWYRAYTLNVDDLPRAINRKFSLDRPIVEVSGALGSPERELDSASALNVICLHGTLGDFPSRVTFSTTQYAERLASRLDPWYLKLTADMMTRSFVFVGSTLDETPLWQHVTIRKERGRQLRELRPRSYLVTTSIDRSRIAMLAEYNIEWIPMSAEEFAHHVLIPMQSEVVDGVDLLKAQARQRTNQNAVLHEVANLATNPRQQTEYLLGQEPVWADVQSGRAIERAVDTEVWTAASGELGKNASKNVILITGTAGTGKSSSLMRLALRCVAEGHRVAWISRDTETPLRTIRGAMSAPNAPSVIAIDDADIYGQELSNLIRDLTRITPHPPLVVVAMRTTRIDRSLIPSLLMGAHVLELVMPPLEDRDIANLLDVLQRENRLGFLAGKPRQEQEKLLRMHCGRQLLVAMIQATTNRRFEDKAIGELEEMTGDEQRIYALIVLASSFRFSLSKDEIVLGVPSDKPNELLNALDRLARRHVVVEVAERTSFRARHRVIADVVLDRLKESGTLHETIQGFSLMAATKVSPDLNRREKPWRMLRATINHDFMARTIGREQSQNVYGLLEPMLAWDFQFWLQRGSLEVEGDGDLSLAELYLNHAYGFASEDPYVRNEYAYMLFRKALSDPTSGDASTHAGEAVSILETLIYQRGQVDPYPYHVLGSQGLAWSRRGITDRSAKEVFLRRIETLIQEGCQKHPRSTELQSLQRDVKREVLGLAVQ